MSFSLAGRPTLVILNFLSLAFLFNIVLCHSHSSSRSYHIQKRDIVYPLQARQVTVTDDITTTVFTTGPTVTASSVGGKQYSTSTHSSRGSSSSSSSSSASILSALSSSSSQTRSHSHKSSRASSTFSTPSTVSSVFVTPTTTSALILVPTPLIPTPSTTLVVTDSPSLVFPTSVQTTSSSSASAVPLAATRTGFLGNKGAVGGTFAVVGLTIAGLLVFLFVIYLKRVKKIRSRRFEQGLSNSLFGRDHSWHESTASARSLNQPPLDPFAAGEVVQIFGSVASFHATGGTPTRPSAPGSRVVSDDGHTSSHDHSSNHHGFSSISYRTGLQESRAGTPQPEPPALQHFTNPASPPIATSQPRSRDPFPDAAAVPLYADMASLTSTNPSLYRPGRIINPRQADSDASYYAGQMHSYYYGGDATASMSPPRSYGQAL